MTETRQFRSRLNTLPLDVKIQLGELPYQKGMRATSRKERAIEVLKNAGIEFTEVGTGTNRFIVKYMGYALKIALDREGVADNRQEWAMCEALSPDVAYAYEISKGGHLMIEAYCPAFTTMGEMYVHRTAISKILSKWSQRYLLGDVGIKRETFANWGLSPDGRPVCIDYAYIFPASLDLFECICGNKTMTFYDNTFSTYKCVKCGRKYEDRELRSSISQQERLKLFENVTGITMKEEYEEHPIDIKYVKANTNPDMPNPYDVACGMLDHQQTGMFGDN